jgi:hypothetical protein
VGPSLGCSLGLALANSLSSAPDLAPGSGPSLAGGLLVQSLAYLTVPTALGELMWPIESRGRPVMPHLHLAHRDACHILAVLSYQGPTQLVVPAS